MEQNELLLQKLQASPEYRAFQDERKTYALRALLFSIFFFGAVMLDTIRSVTHGSVSLDVMFMAIAFICLVVSIGLVFNFTQKPIFITNGVIKEVQQTTYRHYKTNWYLASDGTDQEYWGKSPSFLFSQE